MAITRTAMIDDDGSGTTGTIINNAWKTELYNQIDGALGAAAGVSSGAWTPTVTGSTGGTGQTYGAQIGSYLRVGALVHVAGLVILSAKGTISGDVIVQGLPFAVAAGFRGTPAVGFFQGVSAVATLLGDNIGNDVRIFYVPTTGNTASATLPATMITSAFGVQFALTYQTSAAALVKDEDARPKDAA